MFSSKGIGVPAITLAVSVVCAIRQAINSYRGDHGSQDDWPLEIPLTSERIRFACLDKIVHFVRDKIDQEKYMEGSLNEM